MRATFRIATALTALLALGLPASAQTTTDGTEPPAATGGTDAPDAADARNPGGCGQGGGRGRGERLLDQGTSDLDAVLPPAGQTRPERLRDHERAGAEFTGFKVDFTAGFTSQVQDLTHRNSAVPVVVGGVNTNQLADIGFGFNNSTANLGLHAQLAPGIRVALTSYLSSRHHNETWVKDGYLQMDQSPIDFAPLKALMEIVTVRVGHLEINYGDAHFRRSDNGNAIYNPFVGNYIMDAFTTEIGGEVYLKAGTSSRWRR